jgi:DNA-binding PadR family transcriptional regulator
MKRNEFARNLAAGTYDLIVLDVLRDGPSYGYGIRQRIFEQSKGTIHWQDGTIYPVLRHLENQGLIAGSWNHPKRGHERRYYRLTGRGRRVWREQRRQWNSFTRAVDALLRQ